MSRLALQGAAADSIISFAMDDGCSIISAGLYFEDSWAGPLQADRNGLSTQFVFATRSRNRRHRAREQVVRQAFRQALALEAALGEAGALSYRTSSTHNTLYADLGMR